MVNFKIAIFCILMFISCSTNTEPIYTISSNYDVYINPTSKSGQGYVEFKFTNTSLNVLKYTGYSENSPFYMVQVKNDTGWINTMGWCGTGAKSYNFYPGQSFKTDVYRTEEHKLWRVGLYTTNQHREDGKYSWSAIQN